MKLFVTGGSGFIGSHFLNAALLEGHFIVALRRSPVSTPRIPIIGQEKIQWLDKSMFEVAVKDFHGCNVVVHLAAHSANFPYDTLENCINWNVLAPLALFRKAMKAGLRRFLIAGSCFEYGKSADKYKFIPPSAPLKPTQSYPASKAIASIAFYQMAIEYELELSIHRIFQVFGEGEREDRLWPSLKKAAIQKTDFPMSPSKQIRDFITVKKVARKLLQACNKRIEPGHPFLENIGNGKPMTVKKFAQNWWKKWKAEGKLLFGKKAYRKDEIMRFVAKL